MEIKKKRLDQIDAPEQHWHKLHGLDWRNKKQYDTFAEPGATGSPMTGLSLMARMKSTATSALHNMFYKRFRNFLTIRPKLLKMATGKIPKALLEPSNRV